MPQDWSENADELTHLRLVAVAILREEPPRPGSQAVFYDVAVHPEPARSDVIKHENTPRTCAAPDLIAWRVSPVIPTGARRKLPDTCQMRLSTMCASANPLVDIAPTPRLARLEAPHNWMLGQREMALGMPAYRGVAAPDISAPEADA
jgi:hypothetical protein